MKKNLIILLFLIISTKLLIGQSYSYVRVADKPLYEQYLKYCNKLVLDTVMFVGYKTEPILKTYVNNYTIKGLNDTIVRKRGSYLIYNVVVSYRSYSNESRKKKYKNIAVAQPKLPIFTPPKKIHFSPITYWCLQRKPSIRDFYEWYYKLDVKPK